METRRLPELAAALSVPEALLRVKALRPVTTLLVGSGPMAATWTFRGLRLCALAMCSSVVATAMRVDGFLTLPLRAVRCTLLTIMGKTRTKWPTVVLRAVLYLLAPIGAQNAVWKMCVYCHHFVHHSHNPQMDGWMPAAPSQLALKSSTYTLTCKRVDRICRPVSARVIPVRVDKI